MRNLSVLFLLCLFCSAQAQTFYDDIWDHSGFFQSTISSLEKSGSHYFGLSNRGFNKGDGLQYSVLFKSDDRMNYIDSVVVVRDSLYWGIMEFFDVSSTNIACVIAMFDSTYSHFENQVHIYDHNLNLVSQKDFNLGAVEIQKLQYLNDSTILLAGGELGASIYFALVDQDLMLLRDTLFRKAVLPNFSDFVELSSGNLLGYSFMKYRIEINPNTLEVVDLDSSFTMNRIKVITHPNGFYYACGDYGDFPSGGFQMVKMDSSGAVVDSFGYGGFYNWYNFTKDEATVLNNGNLLAVAIKDSITPNGTYDGIEIFVLDPELNLVSKNSRFIPDVDLRPFAAAPTDDGGAVVVGYVADRDNGWLKRRTYYLRLDSLGNFSHISLAESEEQSALTVFPNPAEDRVKLHSGKVPFSAYSLRIFDLTGKEVLSTEVTSAEHDLELNLPSGHYTLVSSRGDIVPLVIR